jgi:hypothetical protein
MPKEPFNNIPKIIWFMWLQGFDSAPMLVKKCFVSWGTHNPNWEIVFLDEGNIGTYLDFQALPIRSKNISKQAISDLVRINLLAQYGGVWADATCFCHVSLDTWLNEYTKSGFFAFYRPWRDRLLGSWFLASTKHCRLISKWRDESNEYWRNNNFSRNRNPLLNWVLTRILSRSTTTTRFWFSFVVRRILKAYPYHWFHYLFERVIQKDTQCMRIWAETKKYSADIPHKVFSYGLLQPLSKEIKQHIDNKQSPVYKLSWRYNVDEYKEGCTLHYLLESVLRKDTDAQGYRNRLALDRLR